MDEYNKRMASKLGLSTYKKEVAVALLTAMYEDRADFTNTFRALANVSVDDEPATIPPAIKEVCSRQLHIFLFLGWLYGDLKAIMHG